MLIDNLINKIDEMQNPTVVGLDPQLDFIPKRILKEAVEKDGETLEAAANAFSIFNRSIIDEICGIVPAVKPQIAMYEQLGTAGIKCYIDTCNYAKSKGLLVIGDIKRSDIASTAQCYSRAHIGKTIIGNAGYTAFASDFVTINPYLGEDSITPFISDCKEHDKGLFVLVKTSNAGGGLFQNLISDGKELYKHVGDFVDRIGSELIGQFGYSNIGAVVGATYPGQIAELRECMPHTFFLIPGYGAQGGTAQDIKPAFDKNGRGAIVNSSRGIIAAYKQDKYRDKFSEEQFAQCARQAALDMKNEIYEGIKGN